MILDNGENSQPFYRIPKFLFGDEYKNILSTDAKLLYALLLDRASLSAQNGWLAEDGRVFLYFTVAEASKNLSFGNDKIIKLFKEIEDAGLIERKRMGRGKAAVIFVNQEVLKTDFKKSEKPNSRSRKNRTQVVGKSECNNTEYNNNYSNKTYLTSKGEWEAILKENVAYDFLIGIRAREKVDSFVSLATDVLCGFAPTYRINNADVPYEAVRDRLLSLNEDHVTYAVDVMDDIEWKVGNLRSYMLNVLYNAPDTMEAYNQALFNRTYGKR